MFFKRKEPFGIAFAAQITAKTIVIVAGIVACTPTFNWRDVHFERAGLSALLPCKPDRASRLVQIGGQNVTATMAGCEAGGAMFTVALYEAPLKSREMVALNLMQMSKATHSKFLERDVYVAHAAIYSQAKEQRSSSGALSMQEVETFLSGLHMAGVK